jgi:hypothetical protein
MAAVIPVVEWGSELEESLFIKVAGARRPELTIARAIPPNAPSSAEQLEGLLEDWKRTAAHDLFIVQNIARVIDGLFADQPDVQLLLSRQLGDDGHHARVARQRILAATGKDPLPEISRYVDEHWERAGNIPYRSLAGFLAFEFHYELYILVKMRFMKKTALVADDAMRTFSENHIRPDEAAHRKHIVNWWLNTLTQADVERREHLVAEILEHDNLLQNNLNDFLAFEFSELQRIYGCDIDGIDAIYNQWRRELLGVLLDKQPGQLEGLTPGPALSS